jgi:hypothetical protein
MLEGISIDYIETTLGMKTSYQQWPHESELPYYLRDRYEFSQATIGNIKTIFVYPKMNLDQMGSVKKQISRIQKIEPLPVVFVLKSIDRNRRTYMISAKIPFIVPNNQIYLPFMGIVLQDRFKTEKIPMIRLQPSTQVLFFPFPVSKTKFDLPERCCTYARIFGNDNQQGQHHNWNKQDCLEHKKTASEKY